MSKEFNGLGNYNDVASRIVEFRDKFPEGSLTQVDLQFLNFAGKDWVVYTAAAYHDGLSGCRCKKGHCLN